MRKKTSLTIVERAMVLVPEFKSRAVKLEHQVVLRGQSASTLNNYIRRIALFVIHFEKLPEQVSEDEINEYLVALARDPKAPSRSSFKHMVYGLRYYYRLLGMNKKAIALPSLKQDTKLPIVLTLNAWSSTFARANTRKTGLSPCPLLWPLDSRSISEPRTRMFGCSMAKSLTVATALKDYPG